MAKKAQAQAQQPAPDDPKPTEIATEANEVTEAATAPAVADDRPHCPRCHQAMVVYREDREWQIKSYRCENDLCGLFWKRHKYRIRIMSPRMRELVVSNRRPPAPRTKVEAQKEP
ncbi:MAG: hypothetical protein ACYC35_28205 [Pirellulales bacterium]